MHPRRPTGAQHRGSLLLGASLVILAYGPIDRLLAGSWSRRLLATRLVWAASAAVVGVLMRRAPSVATQRLVGFFSVVAAPMFQGLIATWSGPVGNPMYSWLVALPLVSVLISQEAIWASVLASVAAVAATCVAVDLADGSARAVACWGLVVAIAGAHAVAVAHMFRRHRRAQRDATRARQAVEARLAESERRRALAERLALAGELASGIAHEVNNPLASAMANLGCLERESQRPSLPGAELEATFRDTREGLERIRRIVGRLHDFSQQERVRRDLAPVERVLEEATTQPSCGPTAATGRHRT